MGDSVSVELSNPHLYSAATDSLNQFGSFQLVGSSHRPKSAPLAMSSTTELMVVIWMYMLVIVTKMSSVGNALPRKQKSVH